MTLVVVGLNFRAVGLVGIVHGVVETDDLRVVRAVVVVEIVQTRMGAINARIDDGDGDARAVVAGLLLGQIDFMNHGGISVLNRKNTVELKHHDAREGRCFQNHVVGNSPSNRIDVLERPLVLEADFSLKHGNVRFSRRVVKVDDEREGVGFVQKQRMVVVFLNHVANPVLVTVNRRVDPPTDLFSIIRTGMDGDR